MHNYPIHPDLKNLRSFNMSFHPWMNRLFNTLIKLTRMRDRAPHPEVARERVRVRGATGAVFDVITFRPRALQKPAPALIYFHGGAFALTYTFSHLRLCERYASQAQCLVIFADYRLAPEYPFPHGFNDCYAALAWTLANAATLGADSARIALMGDSAGAALAAGVAQKAADDGLPICAQLLIHPVLDSDCKTRSANEFVDVPLWNAVSNRRMWRMYLKDFSGMVPPYAVPSRRTNLRGLPRTYIETAQFDPLHDEGLAYTSALREQGVTVDLYESHGTVHGFDLVTNNPQAVESWRQRIEYLKSCFDKTG